MMSLRRGKPDFRIIFGKIFRVSAYGFLDTVPQICILTAIILLIIQIYYGPEYVTNEMTVQQMKEFLNDRTVLTFVDSDSRYSS